MYLKELVEKMNSMNTMLVRITFGGTDKKGLAYARPAYYNGDDDSAILYQYIGPLDPRRCDFPGDNANVVEHVEKTELLGRGKDNYEVFPYETYLDTMPLRDLPLWAKEMWVKQMEESLYSVIDVNRHIKISMMKKLIAQEGRNGGLTPDMMDAAMKDRHVRIIYALEGIKAELGKGLTLDNLNKLYSYLDVIKNTIPGIRELPWMNEDGLDPNSWFNREDTFEIMTDMLHDAMQAVEYVIQGLINKMEWEGKKDD